MHDRRIDGKTHTFGNFGILYKSAMTWWDHETESVWSQPIGTAIRGPYTGTRLRMVPAAVMPWATWKAEHPDTLVLEVSGRFNIELDPFGARRIGNYVLGVELDEHAKAFRWDAVSARVVVNDFIGGVPVVVYANPADRSAHIFVRLIGDTHLEFEWREEEMRDRNTGSLWDPASGKATAGPLNGQALRELPYSTALDWAWKDFYPESEFYDD